MRAAAGCCCNGSMNDTTYAYDAGGAAGPGTNGSDSYGSNPYGSPAPGPQPKPKRQSDRFFSWIRGSAMERGDDRWIAGVCSAIAQRVGWSPTLVRALVLASVVLCGFGLALYAIAWALLPDARDGRILGEELIDGRWDWNMLGVIIMMMLAVAVPGAGLAAALCAALVLWALVQNANRRHGGYGSGSGVSGTGDSENGSYRRGWWPRHTPMMVRTRERRRPMPARLAHQGPPRRKPREVQRSPPERRCVSRSSSPLRDTASASPIPPIVPHVLPCRTSRLRIAHRRGLFHRNTSAASRPVSPSSSA